jgi:hypothetical protein
LIPNVFVTAVPSGGSGTLIHLAVRQREHERAAQRGDVEVRGLPGRDEAPVGLHREHAGSVGRWTSVLSEQRELHLSEPSSVKWNVLSGFSSMRQPPIPPMIMVGPNCVCTGPS